MVCACWNQSLSGVAVNTVSSLQVNLWKCYPVRGADLQYSQYLLPCTLNLTFNQFRDLFAISYVASFSSVFTINPSQFPTVMKQSHTVPVVHVHHFTSGPPPPPPPPGPYAIGLAFTPPHQEDIYSYRYHSQVASAAPFTFD